MRTVSRRNPCGYALARLDGLSKGRAKARRVLLRHGEEAQIIGALLGQSQADQASAEFGHEIDGLGSDKLGGQGQVALVFPVLPKTSPMRRIWAPTVRGFSSK